MQNFVQWAFLPVELVIFAFLKYVLVYLYWFYFLGAIFFFNTLNDYLSQLNYIMYRKERNNNSYLAKQQ